MTSEQIVKEEKLNTYLVSGWVQIEVFARIKAKNIPELIKTLKEQGNMQFEDGNWESGINCLHIDERNRKEHYKDLEELVSI